MQQWDLSGASSGTHESGWLAEAVNNRLQEGK
jgi:hypothetical protein